MANSKWDAVEALPDGLDETQAVVYREVERTSPAMLGGRHLVFPDGQVWWQQADGTWKPSIYTATDFDDPRWERAEA